MDKNVTATHTIAFGSAAYLEIEALRYAADLPRIVGERDGLRKAFLSLKRKGLVTCVATGHARDLAVRITDKGLKVFASLIP